MECARTFVGENVCRGGLFEVIGLTTIGPLSQEVPQNNNQDSDTGDTTNYTTSNCANGSSTCGHDGQNR